MSNDAMPPDGGAPGAAPDAAPRPPLDQAPGPPARTAATSGAAILQMAQPYALLAIAAMLLGRAVAPSMAGLGVGLGRLVTTTELCGDVLTQLVAAASTFFVISEVLAAMRTRMPAWLRAASVLLGGLVLVISLSAASVGPHKVTSGSLALLGAGSTLLALLASIAALRVRFARGAAVVVALVALSSMVRLLGIAVAFVAQTPGRSGLDVVEKGLATAAFAGQAAAVVAGLVVLGASARAEPADGDPSARAPRRLTSPVAIGALVAAFLLTKGYFGFEDDAGPASTLLHRAVVRLLTHPDPGARLLPLRVFVAVLAPIVSLATVARRAKVPALAAASALALLAVGTAEVPLASLMLVVASLSLALAAHDERGLWAALTAGGAAPR